MSKGIYIYPARFALRAKNRTGDLDASKEFRLAINLQVVAVKTAGRFKCNTAIPDPLCHLIVLV